MSESRKPKKESPYCAFTLEKGMVCHEHKFAEEFEVLSELGEGGFAKVFRVASLLDGKEYAVKRVSLSLKKSSRRIKEDIDAALSEVRLLAKFQKQPNIVRIFHAWVEAERKPQRRESEELEMSFEKESSFYLELIDQDSNEFFIKANEDSEDEAQYRFMANKSNEVLEIGGRPFKINELKKLRIYIQMELCEETLGQRIKNTNEKLPMENNPGDCLISGLKLFREFSRAVSLLHSEGLIHRDLKPDNVFLCKDRLVLGDFGLTTEVFNVKYKKFSIDTSDTRRTSVDSSSDFSSRLSYHTKNVGTLQYSAPEQINRNFYDQKADIFSMGLVLFELLYPMKTGMERHSLMKNLKEKNTLPEFFMKAHPELAELILKMCSACPDKRPDINSVLSNVEDILSLLILENQKRRSRFLSESDFSNINNNESEANCNYNSNFTGDINNPSLTYRGKENGFLKNKKFLNEKKILIKEEKKNIKNFDSKKLKYEKKYNNIANNEKENTGINIQMTNSDQEVNFSFINNQILNNECEPKKFNDTTIDLEKASVKFSNKRLFILPHRNSKGSLIFDLKDYHLSLKESEVELRQAGLAIHLKSPSKQLKSFLNSDFC